ncbi:MAG: phenylacetate--CoA ligase family protein, partial [Lachnospiraceae bacterium]|nr:phenylacetate--CoA ligase family protein [Lachnospiraceae bacterium]
DMMWFEDQNGNHEFLHPLAIEGICIEGIIDYQFRQTAKDAFELSVETEENADLEKVGRELPELIDSILEKKLKFVRYRIRYVEQIKPNPKTGKKPLILAGIIANLLSA